MKSSYGETTMKEETNKTMDLRRQDADVKYERKMIIS